MKQCVHTHMSHSCKLECKKATLAMKFMVLQRDSVNILLALTAATTGDAVMSCNQTNGTVLRNTSSLASQPGAKCRNESQVIFSVQEEALHVCFISFNFTMFICSANEGVVGKICIVSSTGVVVPGIAIYVITIEKPNIVIPTQGIYSTFIKNINDEQCSYSHSPDKVLNVPSNIDTFSACLLMPGYILLLWLVSTSLYTLT